MKVIFLDIDGVLNTLGTKLTVAGYQFVDDDKVTLLQELVDATGAKLVLTSTWRDGWAMLDRSEAAPKDSADVRLFEALRAKLQEHGMALLDYTPHLDHRGKEIDAWLSAWPGEPIDSYVVLDDMNGRHLRPHSCRHIQTSMFEGLKPRHVKKAMKLLNEKGW